MIKGSHEWFLMEPELDTKEIAIWKMIEKDNTIHSFETHDRKMKGAIPWLQQNAVLWYETQEFRCVHAGLKNEELSANSEYTLLMDRLQG